MTSETFHPTADRDIDSLCCLSYQITAIKHHSQNHTEWPQLVYCCMLKSQRWLSVTEWFFLLVYKSLNGFVPSCRTWLRHVCLIGNSRVSHSRASHQKMKIALRARRVVYWNAYISLSWLSYSLLPLFGPHKAIKMFLSHHRLSKSRQTQQPVPQPEYENSLLLGEFLSLKVGKFCSESCIIAVWKTVSGLFGLSHN